MKIAFGLYKYFPFGGLQRDFAKIAIECLHRGHDVSCYTMDWQGPVIPDMSINILAVNAMRNHKKAYEFSKQFSQRVSDSDYDVVVGFNKMPDLDFYYAADGCFQAHAYEDRGLWYSLSNRYKIYSKLESAVFSPNAETTILSISPMQKDKYLQYYKTPLSRFNDLPPGINKLNISTNNIQKLKQDARAELGFTPEDQILLLIGSGFKTKGLDRILHAVAACPNKKIKLIVIGQGEVKVYLRLAKKLGVADRVNYLGGIENVSPYLFAANALVHPARKENTGTVLLEALSHGLPVLTVDICGYAHYVKTADAGVVLKSPFSQFVFNMELNSILEESKQTVWSQNAIDFAEKAELYGMVDHAVDAITGG